jgi:carbon storage regulator CsrA
MKVVTLRLSESIMIGNHIRVVVRTIFHHAATDTMQVKFGVDAPKDVLVLRSELSGRQPPPEEP